MNPARILVAALLATIVAMPSVGQDAKQPVTKQFTSDLYPIGTGLQWEYRITDLKAPKAAEGAAKKPASVIVTAGAKQIFAVKRKNQQDEPTEHVVGYNLHVQGGGKVLQEQVLVDSDGVYRVSGAGKTIIPPLRILKANAKKGDTWSCESQSENATMKGDFVVDEEVIQVPAGTFKTVVVRSRDFTVGAQPISLAVWYSRDVGMVKQHIQSGNHEVVLELEKFEKK